MKVSIIVPVYNTAKLLERCVNSLTRQSYRDIEILLVNDGSTDESEKICKGLAAKDERIRYFYQENRGLSAARNTGIKNSAGEYLCFVDSDDCVAPGYVENLLNLCTENGTKLSLCGYRLTDEATPVEQIPVPYMLYPTEVISRRDYFLRIYTDKEILYVVAWNKLYHRSLFENLQYEEGRIHEDEGIIHRIIDRCDKIAVNYQLLYFYTVREGSIMKTEGFNPRKMDFLMFLQERMEYFRGKGRRDLEYLTMKNYLVKCLQLYNMPDCDKVYKNHIMRMYGQMLSEMKNCPVKSKKFVLKMEYYKLFPAKFLGVDRAKFLFGE